MQTNSDHSASVAVPHNYLQPEKFFIPRSQRQRFFYRFTLMTLLGWVVGGIVSLAVEDTLNRLDSPVWHILSGYLASIAFAVVFGADQALVLRPYLSGWLWMWATSVGWLIANGVAISWSNYILAIANSLDVAASPELIVILGFLSTISYVISGIWLGLCQWLVLRKHTTDAWWWNFLPAIAFFFISLLIWLLSLLQDFFPTDHRTSILYWSGQGFTAVILGVIPAIALCTLKKKSTTKVN
jgi:hypothetical protein